MLNGKENYKDVFVENPDTGFTSFGDCWKPASQGNGRMIAASDQTRFSSPEEWLQHYDDFYRKGLRPDPPRTRDELVLAERENLLQLHPEWIPGEQGLRMLGLPEFFGRGLPPYNERFRERLLTTIHAVPEFGQAVKQMIGA